MSSSARTFEKMLAIEPSSTVGAWGLLILRVGAGLMVFYVHGWHKFLEGLAYLNTGKAWRLAAEVAEMGFPLPVASAFAAAAVQFVCSLMLIAGLCTRLNAVLLAGTLGVAILQNVLTHRDPQLAVLYTLIMVAIGFLGGGRFSLDAKLFSRDTLSTSAERKPNRVT